MLNKLFFYAFLVGIIAFISSGFKSIKIEKYDWFHLNVNEMTYYSLPSMRNNDYINKKVPFTGKFFIGYKEAIAFKESQGKYKKINEIGYMGKYQFGIETLKTIGIFDSLSFLNSPKMQEKAFVALLAKNKWELKDEIAEYEGNIVGGVRVTESGILAAAHLGGVGSVKRFLKTNGARKCRDQNGASVKSYMKDFGGYETTGIKANKKAKVK
jgi:hypothetical protein